MRDSLRDPLGALMSTVLAARGQLMPWVPVFLSFGIGGYFALKNEPDTSVYAAVGAAVLGLVLLWRFGPERWQVPAAGFALIGVGLILAGARTHLVAAPVLNYRYYGPVEGRIVQIDRSFSDQLRLTLDQVVLERMSPEETPERVRVALHGDQGFVVPEPGLRVILTAHVSPPDGPVEPGGFDFQRLAWYSRLGGVGYTRAPVLALEPPEAGAAGLVIGRLRNRIATAVRARLPGESGGFAAALVTGDRSGISRETTEDLRASNLSHLLAISGLHMGLLTGFVFAALRYGFALIPPLALRLPVKKLAAFLALWAAAFYLALSGGNIATQRAFIMVAVMLVAVMLDRRALTLRSVAIAATIILIMEPESLTEPGFQMSFAATTALVACFGGMGRWQRRVPGPLVPFLTLLLSSAIAGFATAPVAAAHFNRIAEYGLLANLVSVPFMGLLVMPAAVIAALLSLVGWEMPALRAMELGTRWILWVADWVAGLGGAVIPVPAPPAEVLPLLACSAIAALLLRGFGRGVSVAVAVGALLLWGTVDRPTVLISGDGGLVGIMTGDGRALSKPKGAGFIAQSWLEDDGDLADQEMAFGRGGFEGTKNALTARVGQHALAHFTGKNAATGGVAACVAGAVVVISTEWDRNAPTGDCAVFDSSTLRETGALAIYDTGDALRIVSARDRAGRRLWNTRALRERMPPRTDTAYDVVEAADAPSD